MYKQLFKFTINLIFEGASCLERPQRDGTAVRRGGIRGEAMLLKRVAPSRKLL